MGNIIKHIYRKVVPAKLRDVIFKLRTKMLYIIFRQIKKYVIMMFNKQWYSMDYEQPVKLGKLNPNIIFYIIGYYHDENFYYQGILSTWIDFMPQILYALQKGYIPIIDMKNNWKPMMLDETNREMINAWDVYFNQPTQKYDLKDVLQSRNVVFAKNSRLPLSYDIQWANLPLSDSDFKICKQMMKYGNLSSTIVDAGDLFINKNIPVGKKILGVSFRRSFERHHYFDSAITPEGTHIVRMTLFGLIAEIKKFIQKFNYDLIFFTADDRESYAVVKQEFGEKCIFVCRPVGHYFENNKPVPLDRVDIVTCEFNKRENDVMLRGIEYMTDIYILSKCNSLLSAGGSADLFAYILNDKKYEHIIQINCRKEQNKI